MFNVYCCFDLKAKMHNMFILIGAESLKYIYQDYVSKNFSKKNLVCEINNCLPQNLNLLNLLICYFITIYECLVIIINNISYHFRNKIICIFFSFYSLVSCSLDFRIPTTDS